MSQIKLKSLNILVSRLPGGLVAKIGDFGLAYRLSTTSMGQTMTKGGKGSGPWMAPEVYDGKYSEASDSYAFGMVTYEVMTSKLPFEGMNNMQIMKNVDTGVPPDLSLVEAGCPATLTSIMDACLAKSSSARPSFANLVAHLTASGGGSVAAASTTTRRAAATSGVNGRIQALEDMQRAFQREMQQEMQHEHEWVEGELASVRVIECVLN